MDVTRESSAVHRQSHVMCRCSVWFSDFDQNHKSELRHFFSPKKSNSDRCSMCVALRRNHSCILKVINIDLSCAKECVFGPPQTPMSEKELCDWWRYSLLIKRPFFFEIEIFSMEKGILGGTKKLDTFLSYFT